MCNVYKILAFDDLLIRTESSNDNDDGIYMYIADQRHEFTGR